MIHIAPTTDRATCFGLRKTVFVTEQGYSAEGEIDAHDETALHLLARDGGTPVATARVILEDGEAKIGRVCVLAAHRGRGLGADLIRAAIREAQALGARRITLGAQEHAVPFYGKLGFAAYGAPYADEGEPHQMMAYQP